MSFYGGALGGVSSPTQKRVQNPKIRLCLVSGSTLYTNVTSNLTVRETIDASHSSVYKVIIADDPGERTGALAPIDRSNLGSTFFKDEYVDSNDWSLRGDPLIGRGEYAGRVYYARPETLISTGGASVSEVTYGTGDGITYGDAFAGPDNWDPASTALSTGSLRLFVAGEHIARDGLISGGRPVAGAWDWDFSRAGESSAFRSEFRFDYPEIEVNGQVLDRAVFYGGLLLASSNNLWATNVYKIPFTSTTTIPDGHEGGIVTIDGSGDTGTLLQASTSFLWVGTDGSTANDFNSSGSFGIRHEIGFAQRYDDSASSFTSVDSAAKSSATGDFNFYSTGAGADDIFYVQNGWATGTKEFSGIEVNVHTAGAGTYTVAWEYYNGSTWASLGVTDDTNAFKSTGVNTVRFEPPGDWATVAVNSGNARRHIRARRDGGTVTTDPVGTQVQIFAGGTQSSAAASTIPNVYWREDRPSINATIMPFIRDPGTAFGNGVRKNGYRTISGQAGHNPVTTWTQTVQEDDGHAGVHIFESTSIDTLSSNEDNFYLSGVGQPVAVHIINGEDPTNRVMTASFGNRISYGNVDNIKTVGERFRQFDNTNDQSWPNNNWEHTDFSRAWGERPFQINMAGWTTNRTGWQLLHGNCFKLTAGFYPQAGISGGGTLEGLLLQYFACRDIAQLRDGIDDGDGHTFGNQSSLLASIVRYHHSRRTGGAIHLYQTGNWVTGSTALHNWGQTLLEHLDLDNTGSSYAGTDGDASDTGIQLGGDNGDDASLGNGRVDPPTDRQGVAAITIRSARIAGFRSAVRDKWRDYLTDWSNIDCVHSKNAAFRTTGSDVDSGQVVVVPVVTSTTLQDSDVGKSFVHSAGDTGTITNFNSTAVFVFTDGSTSNDFASTGTFTVSTGSTANGSQAAAGITQPLRMFRSKLRNFRFRSGNAKMYDITAAATGDYVIDTDDNIFELRSS